MSRMEKLSADSLFFFGFENDVRSGKDIVMEPVLLIGVGCMSLVC